jgi:ankyrin repeat protein
MKILLCLTALVLPGFTLIGETSNIYGNIPPVFEAVLKDDVERLKGLLNAGDNPNEKSPWGWAPLHQAMYRRLEVTKLLLDAGVDVDVRVADFGTVPGDHWTPLFYAVELGRADLVTELLKHGAKLSVTDARGKPPLFYALQQGRQDIVDLLERSGAPLLSTTPIAVARSSPAYYPQGFRGKAERIPELYQAVMLHDTLRVQRLLDEGIDPNERSPFGWAPLHQAMECDLAICKSLLDHGADPDIRVNEKVHSSNWTPLFFAVYYGRDDLVIELLRHHAKVRISDSLGRSPIWYANDQRKSTTLQLLRAAAGRK